ncbi:MAG: LTA synthase family protein [Candidatus Lambdaproteobacteria bacterium]|nr:LTA synthase family protein [Candidatus Lambdaproteobacteria bacterium]
MASIGARAATPSIALPALHAAWLAFAWSLIERALILSEQFAPRLYVLVHFLVGTGYDLMVAAALGLAVYALGLVRAFAGRLLGAVGLAALLVFNFIDYRYYLQFRLHLPFSTLGYLQEAGDFISSAQEVVLTWNFALMVLLPLALGGGLVLRRSMRPGTLSPPGHAVRMGGLFLAGLLGATASNSYVAKHLDDPLQFPALVHFLRTRAAARPAPVELSAEVKARWGYREPFYPFLRQRAFEGCVAPPPALRELCAGAAAAGGRPNIVFIMLESFRAAELGAYGGPGEISPRFDALARQGVLFRNHYASGFQTHDGIVASYCSTYPNYGLSILRDYPKLHLRCLPELLREKGYRTLWAHNGDAGFDKQRPFTLKIGFERVIDEWDFPLGTERLGWGVSDEALMVRAVDEMAGLREPFFAALLTMTNHHPYEVPPRFRRHQGSGEYGRYLDSMSYTDYAIGRFFEEARKHPFFRNTVVFLYADHSVPQPSPVPIEGQAALMRLHHRIPLLVAAGWLKQDRVVDDVGSQVDIPALALDLVGHHGPLPWVGQSPLDPARTPQALVSHAGSYWALFTPDGVSIDRGSLSYRDPGVSAEAIRRAGEALLVNRWAVQHDRIAPPAPAGGESALATRRTPPAPAALAAPLKP